MARQKGIIKLEGTIGDITFVKTKDGYIAKERTSMNGTRIASDPAFQRTRENNAEFGRAGKAGKILRTSFRGQLQKASDSRMVSRLTKEMIRVIQADVTSNRGLRNVLDGETELLEGFDFNANGKLGTTIYAPYTAAINRTTGVLTVQIPAFIPINMIAAPGGTTHFKVFAYGAEVDFENESYVSDGDDSAELAWNATATTALTLTATLPAASTHPLFLALGIEFLQEVNGAKYALKNGAFNAMALVKVNGA
jgi:hypothetical protein